MNWLSNMFTSDKKKRDILRDLINNKISLSEIKNLTLNGKLEGTFQKPNYNYLLINDFLRCLGSIKYKRVCEEFTSGMLKNIKLVVLNGDITTFEEWIPMP